MTSKRAILYAAVACLMLAIGCGRTTMNRQRDEARKRWAVSRAEMVTKLAEGCYQRGEVGRAQQHLDEIIHSGAPYAPLYVLAARMAADKGDLDGARTFAENAKAIDPKSAEARYVLGVVEQMLGQADRALEEYSEASWLDPAQSKYVLAEAEMRVAAGQVEQAAESLADAAGRMPGRTEVHAALGDVLTLLARHDDAVASYRTALRLEPERPDIKERLAIALFYSGAYAEAEAALAELAPSGPDFATQWVQRMRGDCLLALRRLPEARALYQTLANAQPDSAAPLVGLAKCDILDNRIPAAKTLLEQALAQSPRHTEANALLGYLLMAEGKPAEASPHLSVAAQDLKFADRAAAEHLLAKVQGEK